MKEIHANMDEFMSSKQFMLELVKEQKEKVEKTLLRLADKLNSSEFKVYKEKQGNFLNKGDVEDIYEQILPAVEIMKSDAKRCVENME
jgi:hypothetical protein